MSKDIKKINKMQVWKPTYLWYGKVFITIFVLLSILFFVLNIILKPYMRKIKPELTPWLGKTHERSEQNG
ncbi:MAG: hypothetical protein LBI80_02975 [Endomicrobium sp.]|jgi:hypothetical protein|nr:hypothetical protein [Endomicrobium sp.]